MLQMISVFSPLNTYKESVTLKTSIGGLKLRLTFPRKKEKKIVTDDAEKHCTVLYICCVMRIGLSFMKWSVCVTEIAL